MYSSIGSLLKKVVDIQRVYRGTIGKRKFVKERESFRKRMFFARNQILKKKRSAFIILKFIRSVVLIVRDANSRKKGYHDVYSEKLKTDRDDVSVENMADNEVSDVFEHTNRAVGREMEEEEEEEVVMVGYTSSRENIYDNQYTKGTKSGKNEVKSEEGQGKGTEGGSLSPDPLSVPLSVPLLTVCNLKSHNHNENDSVLYGDRKRVGDKDGKREGGGDKDRDRDENDDRNRDEGRNRGSEEDLKQLPVIADTVSVVDINPYININTIFNVKAANIIVDGNDHHNVDSNTDTNHNNKVIINNNKNENNRKISHNSALHVNEEKKLNLHEKIEILQRMKIMKVEEKNKKYKESGKMRSLDLKGYGDVDKQNMRNIGNFNRISINIRNDSKISRSGNFLCDNDKFNENYKYDNSYDSTYNNNYINNDHISGGYSKNNDKKNKDIYDDKNNISFNNNINDNSNSSNHYHINNDNNMKYSDLNNSIIKTNFSRHSSFPVPTPVLTLAPVSSSSLFLLPSLTTIKSRELTSALTLPFVSSEKRELNKDENKPNYILQNDKLENLYDLLKGGNIKLKTKSNIQLNYLHNMREKDNEKQCEKTSDSINSRLKPIISRQENIPRTESELKQNEIIIDILKVSLKK